MRYDISDGSAGPTGNSISCNACARRWHRPRRRRRREKEFRTIRKNSHIEQVGNAMARGVCAQCVHQRVRLDGELCPLRTPSIKYSHRRHHPAFYLVLLCARVLLLIFDAKRSERAAHKRGKKKTTRTCNLNIHNTICRMLKCTNIIQYVRRQPPPRSLRITKKRPKRMSRKKE